MLFLRSRGLLVSCNVVDHGVDKDFGFRMQLHVEQASAHDFLFIRLILRNRRHLLFLVVDLLLHAAERVHQNQLVQLFHLLVDSVVPVISEELCGQQWHLDLVVPVQSPLDVFLLEHVS